MCGVTVCVCVLMGHSEICSLVLGWNCVPQNKYHGVLVPRTPDCGFFGNRVTAGVISEEEPMPE